MKGLRISHLVPGALLLLHVLAADPRSNVQNILKASDGAAPGGDKPGTDGAYEQGQAAFNEAWDVLQSLDTSTTRYERRSGLLSHTLYYAKEAFYLLFMNGPRTDEETRARNKVSPQLGKAVTLLEEAAEEDNSDALFLLAEMNFYGNYTHPRNFPEALRRYQTLATLTGNSTAQYMIGFMYATGVGNAVERDQAKALLYHTFAAEGGNTRSEMTIAYRHHVGIGAPRDCDQAAHYYKRVADKAIQYYRSGPPGGHIMSKESYRWADEEGGVYGEGASVSSSGPNANRDGPSSSSDASVEDVLEYLDLMSRKGDIKATFSLGKMYYDGTRTMKRNVRKAMRYFGLVAKRYWGKDGKILANHPVGIDKIAAKAAGHIGLMFLRGEGTEQNFDKALTWFKRGRANGDALCQHGLGLIYLHGYGVPEDAVKAASYFKAAADQDYPASETRLGALFLDQGDVATATRYFELAARYGGIEAFYYLAEIANQGIGRERHCGMATAYYKMVAEKAEVVHSAFIESNEAYEHGDKETALIGTMMAAEQGYENAQANAAFLLDDMRSVISLGSLLPWHQRRPPALLRNAALALIYWTRSSKQANTDSLVKMGDYYLRGYGTEVDLDKASTCYHTAAEGQHSAQAFWNLGWMHENGIAVEQDFHMAKRYYDLALATNEEAYLPVKLSLVKLRFRSWWNRVTNGKINSIQPEENTKPSRSFAEWIAAFIEYDDEEEAAYRAQMMRSEDDDDDRFSSSDDVRHREIDGQGHYFDDFDVEFDDGMVESLLIVGLAATLIVLLYLRQQRAMRRAEEREQMLAAARQGGPGFGAPMEHGERDRGFFPRAGEPAFQQWVAGGVGH